MLINEEKTNACTEYNVVLRRVFAFVSNIWLIKFKNNKLN